MEGSPGRSKKLTQIQALVGVGLLQDAETNPVVAPSEIGDWADVSSDTARNRLKELAELGQLKKKRIGACSLVFWLTDAGRARLESC